VTAAAPIVVSGLPAPPVFHGFPFVVPCGPRYENGTKPLQDYTKNLLREGRITRLAYQIDACAESVPVFSSGSYFAPANRANILATHFWRNLGTTPRFSRGCSGRCVDRGGRLVCESAVEATGQCGDSHFSSRILDHPWRP
jgi:hypothetical protein